MRAALLSKESASVRIFAGALPFEGGDVLRQRAPPLPNPSLCVAHPDKTAIQTVNSPSEGLQGLPTYFFLPCASTASIAAFTFSGSPRSEEHTSELQSLRHLVCRLLLEKKTPLAAPAGELAALAGFAWMAAVTTQ